MRGRRAEHERGSGDVLLGVRLRKSTKRIHRGAADTNLEVQVRTGCIARRADQADPNSLSNPDAEAHVDP
jgi:hypothetical protein